MTELSLLLFFTSRSPTFGIKWNLTCLSSLRSVDHQAMFKRLGQSDEDDIEPVLYFDAKLFANPWQRSWSKLFIEGCKSFFIFFLQWILALQDPKFVFTHPDLNLENAFVSEDGSVQGLIKWDGVAAVPLSCGKREISFLAHSRLRSGDVRMGRRSGLLIAAENPVCRFEVLTKFVQKIVELARVKSLDPINNKNGNLEIFDITDELGEVEVEQEMPDFLR
uniref:Aminoglycoside phosphotransferase domain-containing protein n=1 Tax=Coccidioides posadasii RMSCC 3488 TaxID=454284 RepID=A0A0J6FC73_COCPO|nr:hypothetical protein CPAG_02862 [Coccidioides posadasii RMSCC 3488]